MPSRLVFGCVFVGLFVARFIVATLLFVWILPDDDRCPMCNALTLRLESRVWNWFFPVLRLSWCVECGWQGMLQRGKPRNVEAPLISTSVIERRSHHL